MQEIVRLCNRERVRYKASTTFWSAQGYPSFDDTVQLDMRRMDRILDIDERSLFAVVEPGVIAATLQAETMKVGLNTHIPGVGCSSSILAGATSYFGSGPSNLYGGHHFDNLMAMEWVTPTGDLVRTASAGAGLGWFSGEGPGPSMRGVARGLLGSKGAMGVYTKCSVKLFPWPGPATLPVTGVAPAYQVDLGPQFRSYTLAFPDWTAWADATQLIWEAGIGYIAHRQFNMFGRDLKYAMVRILTDPDGQLEDLLPLLEDPEVQAVTAQMQRDFQLVVVGQTMRDMEWQEAALDEILAQTGGRKVEAMLDKAIHDWSLLYMIRLGHKNLNLVFGGSYDGAFGLLGPIDFGASHAEEAGLFKLEWEKKAGIRRRRRRLHDGPHRRPGRRWVRPLGELHLLRLAQPRVHRGHARVLPGRVRPRRRARLGRRHGGLELGCPRVGRICPPRARRDAMHLGAPQPYGTRPGCARP